MTSKGTVINGTTSFVVHGIRTIYNRRSIERGARFIGRQRSILPMITLTRIVVSFDFISVRNMTRIFNVTVLRRHTVTFLNNKPNRIQTNPSERRIASVNMNFTRATCFLRNLANQLSRTYQRTMVLTTILRNTSRSTTSANIFRTNSTSIYRLKILVNMRRFARHNTSTFSDFRTNWLYNRPLLMQDRRLSVERHKRIRPFSRTVIYTRSLRR